MAVILLVSSLSFYFIYLKKLNNNKVFVFFDSKELSAIGDDRLNYYFESLSKNKIDAQIAAGGNINAKGPYGESVLMYAVTHNDDPEIIEYLIRKGANVYAKDDFGINLLQYAARTKNENSLEIAKIFIKYGISPAEEDHYGDNALSDACGISKNLDMIKILVENGADVNSKNKLGKTALFEAVFGYSESIPEIIEYLVDKGADVNVKDNSGNTLLTDAVEHGMPYDVVKMLINYGIDVNEKNKQGYSALRIAVFWNAKPEVLRALIANGANINERDENGKTILMGACEHSHLDTIRFLVKNGADVSATDNKGDTALIYARYNSFASYGEIKEIFDENKN